MIPDRGDGSNADTIGSVFEAGNMNGGFVIAPG